MACKITIKYLKNYYLQSKKCIKQKRLRAYTRALVYLANTMDITLQSLFRHLSILSFFNLCLKAERVQLLFKSSGTDSHTHLSRCLYQIQGKKRHRI